jgi:hypothetical protein
MTSIVDLPQTRLEASKRSQRPGPITISAEHARRDFAIHDT